MMMATLEHAGSASPSEPVCATLIDRLFSAPSDKEGNIISCFENDVPEFIAADMTRLYGSLYSSLPQFHIYTDGTDTSTYIVRKGGKPTTIFLFQHVDAGVTVVNEVIKVSEEEISRFSAYIFSAFPSVAFISFKAVQTSISRLSFPYQRSNYLEDIVLTLPSTIDQYFDSLGKHTRRNIRRQTKRINEVFPTFRFQVYEKGEVDAVIIRKIIDLNRARMAGKNKISAINEEESERLIRLAKECGLVGVVTIDGRICAGGINFRCGENYFLNVIAHDSAYDDYWMGILCCYLTICECIKRSGKEFHFLWGQYDYKYALMGVQRDLDNVAVYRSYFHLLRHSGHAFKMLSGGYRRRLQLWLHRAKHRDNLFSRIATAFLNGLRNFRHL
jgi:hypothetical protein